jgi:hypothetical protein
VVNAIDRCGVSFLKAAAKTDVEICRGLGGTSQECRVARDIIQPDIDWWRAAGKHERAECDADMQTFCSSRCRSAVNVYPTLPTRDHEAPQGLGGVTMVSGRVSIIPRDLEPPQGVAGVTVTMRPIHKPIVISHDLEVRDQLAGAIYSELIPVAPGPSQGDVRQSADGVIEYLQFPE